MGICRSEIHIKQLIRLLGKENFIAKFSEMRFNQTIVFVFRIRYYKFSKKSKRKQVVNTYIFYLLECRDGIV